MPGASFTRLKKRGDLLEVRFLPSQFYPKKMVVSSRNLLFSGVNC